MRENETLRGTESRPSRIGAAGRRLAGMSLLLTALALVVGGPVVAQEPPPPEDPYAGLTYEPIPADPGLFYEGPPPGDAWDTHWAAWDGTYDAWDPANSDWASLEAAWEAAELSEQPDPHLNCDVCTFPRTGLLAIMQNDGHGDINRTSELRKLCKAFMRRTVIESRGEIHDLWQRGVLAGVEFDWFFPPMGAPGADDLLPVIGQVVGSDADGLPLLLANVYCYTARQFAARKAAVEGMIGHTMDQYTVWEDNTITSLDDAAEGASFQGGFSLVSGPVTSLADVTVRGGYHMFDAVAYAGDLKLSGRTRVGTAAEIASVTAPAQAVPLRWARMIARYMGSYHEGDVAFSKRNPPPEGLVFAEGDVTVDGTGLTGTWSFVSATGTVTFTGTKLDATGWMADILALAYAGDVDIACRSSVLRGEISAPQGSVALRASGTVVEGIIFGAQVASQGGSMLLTDGTDPYASRR